MYTCTIQTYSPDGEITTELATLNNEVKVAPTLHHAHLDLDWAYRGLVDNPGMVGVIRSGGGRIAAQHEDGSVRTYTLTRFGN